MPYFESDIVDDLIVEERYNQSQLIIFIVENPNITVISKSCRQFTESSQKIHKVLKIIEGYEHKSDGKKNYCISSSMRKIYILD